MARPSKHANEPAAEPQYLAYEDLPPPNAEERAQIIARLLGHYDDINQRVTDSRRARLLSWAKFAP